MRQRIRWWMVVSLIVGIAVLLTTSPVAAQVKIRFQTWQWNQQPTVKALEEFQRTFNAANPGIQVTREDSRYGDKEAVFATQSQAKAAADIAHFSIRPIRSFADHGFLLDLTPFVEKEGGENSWRSGIPPRWRCAGTRASSTACRTTWTLWS